MGTDRRTWKKQILTLAIAGCLAFSLSPAVAYADTMYIVSGSTQSVNVRSGAGEDYDVIASLPVGSEVTIVGEENGWYEISVNNSTTGYVRSDLLSSTKPSTATEDSDDEDTSTSSSSESNTSKSDTEKDTTENTTSGEDASVMVGETTYTLSDTLGDESAPEGFAETTISYEDGTYPAYYNETMDVTLVYLVSDAQDGLFVYDSATDSFIPMVLIGDVSENYLIVLNAPADFAGADGYTATTLSEDATGTITVYQSTVSDTDSSTGYDSTEVYSVYGVSSNGNTGWYLYDAGEGSYARTVTPTDLTASGDASSASTSNLSSEDYQTMKSHYTKIIVVLIIILVLYIMTTVNIFVFRRKTKDEEDFVQADEDLPEVPDEDAYDAIANGEQSLSDEEQEVAEREESLKTESQEDLPDGEFYDDDEEEEDEEDWFAPITHKDKKEMKRQEKLAEQEAAQKHKEETQHASKTKTSDDDLDMIDLN